MVHIRARHNLCYAYVGFLSPAYFPLGWGRETEMISVFFWQIAQEKYRRNFCRLGPLVREHASQEIRMTTKNNNKIANPAQAFDSPKDIVSDPTLSHREKKSALDSLEYDANQLLVASDERLNGGEQPVDMTEIYDAKQVLKDQASR